MAHDCQDAARPSLIPRNVGVGSRVAEASAPVSRASGDADAAVRSPAWLADLLVLTKARANVAVIATAVFGYALHSEVGSNLPRLFYLTLGTALLAGGASMANQAIEYQHDLKMARTRRRPIASGRLDRRTGFLLSALCCALGGLCLAAGVNASAAIYGLLAYVVYVGIYTPLKRVSPACTLAGSVSGALPVLIGWAAADVAPGVWAWVTFGLLYLWQVPHFMAIAWWRREDYLGAGYRVLPRNDTAGIKTAVSAFIATLAVVAFSFAPAWAGAVGSGYAAGAFICGTFFSIPALRFLSERTGANARRLFLASLIYLPAIFTLMWVCQKPS